jgi:hypothetical protein
MQTIKITLMACLTALFLASCGADSKEKVMDDAFSGMEEMVTILEGVSDKASAEKAKPKLEALATKMKKIDGRLEALGLKKEDLQKEMESDEKYKKKMETLMGKMMGTMMKLATNKEVKEILDDSMKKLN